MSANEQSPTLNRYEIRQQYTVVSPAVGKTGQEAIENWRKQGPFDERGKLTGEAESALELLEPERKAGYTPGVKRIRPL